MCAGAFHGWVAIHDTLLLYTHVMGGAYVLTVDWCYLKKQLSEKDNQNKVKHNYTPISGYGDSFIKMHDFVCQLIISTFTLTSLDT